MKRYSKALPFLLAFLLPTLLPAQGIEWEQNYGGSDVEEPHSIRATDDGGYIVAGTSSSNDQDVSGNNGQYDAWVVKLDDQGNIEWEKNYGGAGNEQARDAIETDNGNFMVFGVSDQADQDVSDNYGGYDIWVLEINSTGSIQWDTNYGGTGHDLLRSVDTTQSGGYIIGGLSSSDDMDVSANNGNYDYWTLELDGNGALQWEANFGGTDREEVFDIQETDDQGFIVCGSSKSDDLDVSGNNGEEDYWIVKLDDSGNLDWEKNFGGSDADMPLSILETENGDFVAAGSSDSDDGDVSDNNGESDHWVVKLDDQGNLLEERNYGGSGPDRSHSLVETSDGGFILAGVADIADGDVWNVHSPQNLTPDLWLLGLDSSLALQWERNYGGGENDIPNKIRKTDDGGYILASLSRSDDAEVSDNHGEDDFWILKLCGITGESISVDTCTAYTVPGGDTTFTSEGIHHHLATNAQGCDSIYRVDLTLRLHTLVNFKSSTELQAFEINADYQWLDCDSGYAPIPGETDRNFVASENGSYAVEITKNGCTDTSSCKDITEVGIADHALEGKVNFHPNPTQERVHVEMPSQKGAITAILRDHTGRRIARERIEDPERFSLNLGENPGLYLIELIDEKGRKAVLRVVKEG